MVASEKLVRLVWQLRAPKAGVRAPEEEATGPRRTHYRSPLVSFMPPLRVRATWRGARLCLLMGRSKGLGKHEGWRWR